MSIKEILECEDLELLYLHQKVLSKQITHYLKLMQEVINHSDLGSRTLVVEYNGELDIIRSNQRAVNNRIEYLSSHDYRNDKNRINHNFIVLAKRILDKDKFLGIYQLANKNLKESKELIKNQTILEI